MAVRDDHAGPLPESVAAASPPVRSNSLEATRQSRSRSRDRQSYLLSEPGGHMEEIFENRVRFAETDMQGIVFYGNYLTYQDETVSEYLRRIGYGYATMEAADWDVHVVGVDLDYRGQATFGDAVGNAIRVTAIGDASITYEYAAHRKPETDDEEPELLAEGTLTHVAVDAATGSPTTVPEGFREAVADFQEEAPDR
jgi:acyl-CoA thioester hydrolase